MEAYIVGENWKVFSFERIYQTGKKKWDEKSEMTFHLNWKLFIHVASFEFFGRGNKKAKNARRVGWEGKQEKILLRFGSETRWQTQNTEKQEKLVINFFFTSTTSFLSFSCFPSHLRLNICFELFFSLRFWWGLRCSHISRVRSLNRAHNREQHHKQRAKKFLWHF